MDTSESFRDDLHRVNEDTFGDIALRVFRYQASENPTYRAYLQFLGVDATSVRELGEVPFLPISFFRQAEVKTGTWPAQTVFRSSGTSAHRTSSHHIRDIDHYLRNAGRCFHHFFGDAGDFRFLALLPSYLERGDSSLVAMIDSFIRASAGDGGGFYLEDHARLANDYEALNAAGSKIILWGVSFALLELASAAEFDFSKALIVETGGMKGRGDELIRAELHERLRAGLGASHIYSEYGMTELLSQAYTDGGDRFRFPPWARACARDITDPLHHGLVEEIGGLNVIDLANVDTVAFIETEDMGRVFADGSFEVLGRLDNTEARGCNLLIG